MHQNTDSFLLPLLGDPLCLISDGVSDIVPVARVGHGDTMGMPLGDPLTLPLTNNTTTTTTTSDTPRFIFTGHILNPFFLEYIFLQYFEMLHL